MLAVTTERRRKWAIHEAWKRGHLRHRLRKHQVPIYHDIKQKLWGGDSYTDPPQDVERERRYVLKCHRRFGKSALVAFIFNELGRQMPGARLYWAAETAKQVQRIILPNMDMALRDCPPEFRPVWKAAEQMWVWPKTEAKLIIAGCEDERKADRLRGDGADAFAIDEAGSIGPLRYVYRSVALWMVAEEGNDGRIIMPSSPAKSPAHPFTEYCAQAEAGLRGGYSCRTVYDSEWSPALIEELAQECGGRNTTDFQREALCMDVVDRERAVVPEFTPRAHDPWRVEVGDDGLEAVIPVTGTDAHPVTGDDVMPPLVREIERPEYFDIYTGMDIGFRDLTAMGFGYYHFDKALLVIEGEAMIKGMLTSQLAASVKQGEKRWDDYWDRLATERFFDDEDRKPHGRVSDIDLRLLHDLRTEHGLHFTPTRRDNLDAQVNNLRLWVQQGKLAIHPRCLQLIAHLKAAIWNRRHSEFDRMEGFGHFDFVAMMVYLVRYVRSKADHNPYPARKAGVSHTTHHVHSKLERKEEGLSQLADRLRTRR